MKRSLAVAVAVLVLAGCGGSATTIDHTIVETGIETGIAQQQHVLSVVSCPKGVKAFKGREFTCIATLSSGRQLPITVRATDAKGHVHYEGFRGFREGKPGSQG